MTCPVCFFRDKTQREIKESCYGLPRFEHKLDSYKKKFIEGMTRLDSISKCECYSLYEYEGMVLWTDDFLKALRANTSKAEEVFDELMSCYTDFISQSQKTALDNLWSFLESNNLVTGSVLPLRHTQLWFRGRPKGTFDPKDIKAFFHIPFTERHKIGNQRFSISGQPMLYLGSSVLTVQKELDLSINDLALAAFSPSYSVFYHKNIFDLGNYINDVVENTLPGLCQGEVAISYSDKEVVPNDSSISDDLQKIILMHICLFPTEHKGSFIPEYVLPQMLTTALMENGYAGMIFPSTKDFSDLSGHHRFSSHHLNFGLFVTYDQDRDVDERLLASFVTYTLDGTESFDLTATELRLEIESLNKTVPTLQDYTLPLIFFLPKIDNMERARLLESEYFETLTGKTELVFYRKMIREVMAMNESQALK